MNEEKNNGKNKSVQSVQETSFNQQFLSKQSDKERLGLQKMFPAPQQGIPQKSADRPYEEEKTLEEIQEIVTTWANKEFPNRKLSSTFIKLIEELSELIKGGLRDPLEYADVLILTLDLAYLAGISNPTSAVIKKMEINKNRVWLYDTCIGSYSHNPSKYKPSDQEEDGLID